MAAGKKRTTMAKLNRETRMREKRFEKEARRAARKLAADDGGASGRPAWLGDPPQPADSVNPATR